MNSTSPPPVPADDGQPVVLPGVDYVVDAVERYVLFLDALRQRGNNDREHLAAGEPDLLKFEHELVLDGSTLPRPCNYALLRILPLDGREPDPAARPVMVVDPRAGHGPGIGGFKADSEVGMALQAGHPVYFVSFRPQPEPGQTLLDVATAEAVFLETLIQRHPQCASRPLVIGNCQAGWAMAGLAAIRPELFGTLVLVGSPLSYWAGGASMNPMRYSGAMLGGAWLAALTSDLNGDLFDGAHLVDNFEKLNPAHALWSRHYRLWSQVDHEVDRYLDFERWWGGYFRMGGAEIEAIVENLFVGNRLARGDVQIGPHRIDLHRITSPVVVFASWGDNITPPPQALNWIIDVWGDERAIAAAGRVIVYVLHETVGHLGIFVGADIARKEHDQIITSLDVIDSLPPGLYEMKLQAKEGAVTAGDPAANSPTMASAATPGAALEPGRFRVHFEPRTMNHLRALNPEGRDEEQLFSTVAQLSEINTGLYKAWVRPWLRQAIPAQLAQGSASLAADLHPMRQQRQWLSDGTPGAQALAGWAEQVRADRHPLPADSPWRAMEQAASSWIELGLNLYRDLRDQATVHASRTWFGPAALGAWLPPAPSDDSVAVVRAEAGLRLTRGHAADELDAGGFPQAVCRIVMALLGRSGKIERRSLRLIQRLSERRHRTPGTDPARPMFNWREGIQTEARIQAVLPDAALDSLPLLLPDPPARLRALAIGLAALHCSEPESRAPALALLDELTQRLDADPGRVAELAEQLTRDIQAVEAPLAA